MYFNFEDCAIVFKPVDLRIQKWMKDYRSYDSQTPLIRSHFISTHSGTVDGMETNALSWI